MTEQLVTINTAKLAKENGFDWKCMSQFNDDGTREDPEFDYGSPYMNFNSWSISAPPQSLLQKWLRDVHRIHIEIKTPDDSTEKWHPSVHIIHEWGNKSNSNQEFYSYEQALEAGLVEALKLIDNNKA